MKILIADDDEIVRAVVQRVVLQASHDCLEAEDGLEALSLIERFDPDLLITDLRMPLVDGFQLIETVRESPFHKEMPILCISLVREREEIARLASLGISDYVLKPLRPLELLERLRLALHRSAAWKQERNGPPPAADALPVLVIDADASYRAFVGAALAPEFRVLGAASGADGVMLFSRQRALPGIVLVADNLALLGDERTAELLRQVGRARPGGAPVVLLMSGESDVAPERAARFDGVVRRVRAPDVVRAAAGHWMARTA